MTMVSPDDGRPSVSRTARYKKVTKPLLERKRRARINRCLDELKDLMVGAFEVEGDNISKLEKADILELTLRYLTKLHSPQDPVADAKRFQAGFGQCAAEACQFILSMPGVDTQIGQNLVRHLSSQITEVPLSVQVAPKPAYSPTTSCDAPTVWSNPPSEEFCRTVPESPKETFRVSSPEEYESNQRRYRKEEATRVPVEQSLVCDTLNSISPKTHEYPPSMPGLLMTVNEQIKPTSSSAQAFKSDELYRASHQIPDGKHNEGITQSSEAKHIIMKKIRDQILERQVREIDSKMVTASSAHDLRMHRNHYAHPEPQHSENGTMKRHHSKISVVRKAIEEPCSSSSGESRKKFKGEMKHYDTSESEAGPPERMTNSSSREMSHEFADYTSEAHGSYSRETYKAVPEPEIQGTSINSSNNLDQKYEYPVQKKRTDYRNIHPKKVIIRNDDEDQKQHEYEERNFQRRQEVNDANERIARSSLREQRLKEQRAYPGHPDGYHRYLQSPENLIAMGMYKRASLEGHRRLGGPEQQYQAPMMMDPRGEMMPGQGYFPPGDLDDMWRPW